MLNNGFINSSRDNTGPKSKGPSCTSRKNNSELIKLSCINGKFSLEIFSFSKTGLIRDAPYWTSTKKQFQNDRAIQYKNTSIKAHFNLLFWPLLGVHRMRGWAYICSHIWRDRKDGVTPAQYRQTVSYLRVKTTWYNRAFWRKRVSGMATQLARCYRRWQGNGLHRVSWFQSQGTHMGTRLKCCMHIWMRCAKFNATVPNGRYSH